MIKSMNDKISELQIDKILPKGEWEITSWEQQFSYVYRVEINGSVFFFKHLKDRKDHSNDEMQEKLVREFEALVKLTPVFQRENFFNIPRPVYFSKNDLLLVTEEVKGIQISSIVFKYIRRFRAVDEGALEVCKRVGEFLKVLHDSEEIFYTTKDLSELTKYIKKRLVDGVFTGEQKKGIDEYMTSVEKSIRNKINSYKKNPIHHDFNLSNIFSDNKNINVIDFGDYRIDHYSQDIIYFKLMVDGLFVSSIKYRKSAKEKLFSAFCEGYGIDYMSACDDELFKLILLKNLSIFLKTFIYRKEETFLYGNPVQFIISLKDKIINQIDLNKTKKLILQIVQS